MAQQTFDHSEFVKLRYYSGVYGCAASTARINYYGLSGVPNQVFNGTHQIIGASLADAQGGQYMDVIRSYYYDPVPIRLQVQTFERAQGDVTTEVEMYSETASLVDVTYVAILIEDDVSGSHTHVTRDYYTETFSLSGAGNTAVFNHNFTFNPQWDAENLNVVAFVQLPTKEIIQAGSSYAQPDFSIRAMVPFDRSQIGPSTGTVQGEFFTLMNVGQTDTFTIDVVIDEAPAGWGLNFCDQGGTCYDDPVAFGLTEQTQTVYRANITPNSPGYMKYHFEVTSTNLAKTLQIPFVYTTDDVDVLVIDDDAGADYEVYFESALTDSGFTYGVWDRGSAKLTTAVKDNFDVLVWNTGLGYPTFDRDDRMFVESYLDAGKNLFVSGQDVGWDLNASGSNNDPTFYQGRLKALYRADDTNRYVIDGKTDDPITDNLSVTIEGGDGADNSEYPSRIDPINGSIEILNYHGLDWGAGVRSEDEVSGARVVYVSFGFEAVNRPEDRAALLGNAVNWLNMLFGHDFEDGVLDSWSEVVN